MPNIYFCFCFCKYLGGFLVYFGQKVSVFGENHVTAGRGSPSGVIVWGRGMCVVDLTVLIDLIALLIGAVVDRVYA